MLIIFLLGAAWRLIQEKAQFIISQVLSRDIPIY